MIFNANPDATKAQNDDGWLPLHVALEYKASDSVIKMLADAFPGSINIKYKCGKLPLDLYKGENADIRKWLTPKSAAATAETTDKRPTTREYENNSSVIPSSSDSNSTSKKPHTEAFLSNTSDKTVSPKPVASNGMIRVEEEDEKERSF
jgi:hypothetical protein